MSTYVDQISPSRPKPDLGDDFANMLNDDLGQFGVPPLMLDAIEYPPQATNATQDEDLTRLFVSPREDGTEFSIPLTSAEFRDLDKTLGLDAPSLKMLPSQAQIPQTQYLQQGLNTYGPLGGVYSSTAPYAFIESSATNSIDPSLSRRFDPGHLADYSYQGSSSYDLRSTVPFETSTYGSHMPFHTSSSRHSRPRPIVNDSALASFGFGPIATALKSASPDYRRQHFKAERPKKDRDHDWVRVNGSTEGKSSRTGKINGWDSVTDGKYQTMTQHPIGRWTGPSTGTDFEYTRYGELKARTFSPAQIKDFLFNHAQNLGSNLVIWIQRSPADSGRRYETQQSDKCIFDCCPASGKDHRNILVGHLRVAFDEQWLEYREKRNPMYVAGYAHLYCLERFCDFPAVCISLDVRPDNRHLQGEPRGKWAASVGDDRVYRLAKEFIELSSQGRLYEKYPQYPFYSSRNDAEPKPFDQTLTYTLTNAKIQETSLSKKSMMASRGMTAGSILVHRGDLQMLIDAKAKGRHPKKVVTNKGKAYKRREKHVDEESDLSSAPESEDESVPAPAFARGTKRPASGAAGRRMQGPADEAMICSPILSQGSTECVVDTSERAPERPSKRSKQHTSKAAPVAPMLVPSLAFTSQSTTSRHAALGLSPYSLSSENVEPSSVAGSIAATGQLSRRADLMDNLYGF